MRYDISDRLYALCSNNFTMLQVREALKSRLAPEYELYEHVRRRLLAQYAHLPNSPT